MTVAPAPLGEEAGPRPVEAGSGWHPPSARRVLLGLAVAGIAADVGLRGGPAGLGTLVAVVALVAVLVLAAPARTWSSLVCAAAAVATAAWVVVSTSPWRIGPDLAATVLLVVLAAGLAHGPSALTLTFPDIGRRLLRPIPFAAVAPLFVTQSIASVVQARRARRGASGGPAEPAHWWERASGQRAPVARGLVLATPVVVGIGLLLGAADPVFASFFDLPHPDLAIPTLFGHVALFALGGWAAATLLADAASPVVPLPEGRRPLGPIEAGVVLAGLTFVYAMFAVAQVVVAVGGADHVLRTQGLTAAEYARSGFFQLLWAAGITVVVLVGVRGTTREGSRRSRRALAGLSAVASALTLVVVGTAIHRLGVYQSAYGLTMLRLTCTVFAWWLGVVFVLLAVRVLMPGRREWLPALVLASAVIGIAVFNAMDPEAVVVRANLARAESGHRFDASYLAHLSDDAVPAMAASLPELDGPTRAAVLAAICRPTGQADSSGWPSANLARRRAEQTRRDVCGR